MWASQVLTWLSLGLSASALYAPADAGLLRRDDVCVPGPNGVATQPQVIVYPVSVQTSCPSNTVITVPGCPTGITVTNAPTSVNTLVTATTTLTVTSTVTTTTTNTAVPTAVSAEANEIIRELNILTSTTRALAATAANLDDGNVGAFDDAIDALSNQLDAFTAIVKQMQTITSPVDEVAITNALNAFFEAQTALLRNIDASADPNNAGNANGTLTTHAAAKRQSTRLSRSSLGRLRNSCRGLQTAVDAYINALAAILPAIAAAILDELALLDALFAFLLEALAALSGAAPTSSIPPLNSTTITSMPSTIPTISISSTSSSGSSSSSSTSSGLGNATITSPMGSGTGMSTGMPMSTSNSSSSSSMISTQLPISLNSTSSSASGMATGTLSRRLF